MRGFGLVVCAACLACPGPGNKPTPTPAQSAACVEADGLVAKAAALQGQGYLGRTLPDVERAVESCPSQTTRLATAEALADLWLDQRAVRAYEAYAASGDVEAETTAASAIAELETRPAHVRDATYEEKVDARQLYRAGQLLRIVDKKYALSLQRFTESYALAPHPLTIVQMGLTRTRRSSCGTWRPEPICEPLPATTAGSGR